MQSILIQAENLAARGGSRKRTQRDSARVHRFWMGRQAETNAEIDPEANRRDEVFARNIPDFFGDG